MKYFEAYADSPNAVETFEVTISCDIDIFEWLIKYIYLMEDWEKHKLKT